MKLSGMRVYNYPHTYVRESRRGLTSEEEEGDRWAWVIKGKQQKRR